MPQKHTTTACFIQEESLGEDSSWMKQGVVTRIRCLVVRTLLYSAGIILLISTFLHYFQTNLKRPGHQFRPIKLAADEWLSSIVLKKASECPAVVEKVASNNEDSGICRIPELDPFHPSIMQFIEETKEPNCPGTTYGKLSDRRLKLVDPNVVSASYRPILRKGDFSYRVGPETPLNRTSVIPEEMIQVSFRLKNSEIKNDFFLQVATKNSKYYTKSSKKPGIPLNILVIGIDSLSYGNAVRKLPNVVEFLNKNNALFFNGHTIAGDGTTPQLTAMLTGKHVKEQYEARTGEPGARTIDDWTWIFKQLKEHGYLTGFSEDGIWEGPFQYRLRGFEKPPTDFYPRPFFLNLAERTTYPSDRCINNRNIPEIHFDYVRTVFNSFPKKLKFFLSFNAGYSHHEINDVQKNERSLMALFQDLKSNGHLNNTLVIVMGDHGLRYGTVRTQVQGKLEERLPLFAVLTPPWFKSKYPGIIKNLNKNRERLTSWFDVYATFRHVLSYPEPPAALTRGQSLFSAVPKTRSCEDIGTAKHWCPCLQWVSVDVHHPHIQAAGLAAVQYINYLLSRHNSSLTNCVKLELKDIHFAQLERPNEAVVNTHLEDGAVFKQGEEYFCRYQLQFVTSPSEGLFEATVKYYRKRFVVGTGISRINKYNYQPACVADKLPHLRKYCLCKDYTGLL